jgi:hypothetical protein
VQRCIDDAPTLLFASYSMNVNPVLPLTFTNPRFDRVFLHFLIVGHTHSIIDQYFSTISKRIYKAEFIASPHALHALIMQTKDDDGRSPAICTFLEVSDCCAASIDVKAMILAGRVRFQNSI